MTAWIRGVLLLMVLVLVGCGSPPTTVELPAPTTPPPTTTVAGATMRDAPSAAPVAFDYPAVQASGNLIPTGLNADGTAEVVPITQPLQTSYLNWSEELRQDRPVVLLGHVDGRDPAGISVPGVFARLSQAQPGDPITVQFTGGRTVVYRVTKVWQQGKDQFPSEVYDPTDVPTLLMITCGGEFEQSERSYRDNVIVTAVAS